MSIADRIARVHAEVAQAAVDAGRDPASVAVLAGDQVAKAAASERLQVGVVGAGGRAGRLNQLFAANKNADIVAIADLDSRRLPGTGLRRGHFESAILCTRLLDPAILQANDRISRSEPGHAFAALTR